MQVRVRISHLLPHGAATEGGAAPSRAAPPLLRHASSAAPAGCCDDAPPTDAASSSTAAALLHQPPPTASYPPATSAMHVVAQLTSDGGDPLALEAQTSYANCQPTSSSATAAGAGTDSRGACMWGEMLTFCIKVVRGALYCIVPHELDCTASVSPSAIPISPCEHVKLMLLL